MENKSLGRGLAAILGENNDNKTNSEITHINVETIIINPKQPRKIFNEEKLKELSESIKKYGIIQPLTVRKKSGNEYELISGERRLKAAKMANLAEVPVYIIKCSDKDILSIALIENLQRDDLNPIEEAEAFKQLIEELNCTQENLAFMICKSRSYITNSMRLLTLQEPIKELIKKGDLTVGHAKLLIGMYNSVELAKECVSRKMTVRELEEYIKKQRESKPNEFYSKGTRIEKYNNPDEEELSNKISSTLGMKSKLKITKNGGMLTIFCSTCEQLENLTQTLLSLGEN